MEGLEPIGRLLIVGGIVLAIVGVVMVLAPNIPFLGRLPGDIRFESENVRVFIPIGTMIVVSIILTILLNVIGRGR
jgi:predicted membrane channel-forming protein YqfA (hemolysin III family)